MRYLYYVIAIVLLVSALAVYGIVDTRVEISKPALSVNDRVLTEAELERLIRTKPYYMNRDEYMGCIITRQVLIQEAIRQKINLEEPFRLSVENYYEHSLIKILLDRKLGSLEVAVTEDELDKYRALENSRVTVSKFCYKNIARALAGTEKSPRIITSNFADLSHDLKFIVLTLKKGQMSKPVTSGMGVMAYRLDDVTPIETKNVRHGDPDEITTFIRNGKKEALMDQWTRHLRRKAKIWRKDET